MCTARVWPRYLHDNQKSDDDGDDDDDIILKSTRDSPNHHLLDTFHQIIKSVIFVTYVLSSSHVSSIHHLLYMYFSKLSSRFTKVSS